MLYVTLLTLLLSTFSFAHVVGRQVLVLECNGSRIIAPVNTANPISCAASATGGPSSDSISQTSPPSSSTTISRNHTSDAGVSTYSTLITTYEHASIQSANSTGSPISIPTGTSKPSDQGNSKTLSTNFSYTDSQWATSSNEATTQSANQLDSSLPPSSSGFQSSNRGTGTASWTSNSIRDLTSVPSSLSSISSENSSRESSSNGYPSSSSLTESSSSICRSSAALGSTTRQPDRSSVPIPSISPTDSFQNRISMYSVTTALSSSANSSSASKTTLYRLRCRNRHRRYRRLRVRKSRLTFQRVEAPLREPLQACCQASQAQRV